MLNHIPYFITVKTAFFYQAWLSPCGRQDLRGEGESLPHGRQVLPDRGLVPHAGGRVHRPPHSHRQPQVWTQRRL